MNNNEQGNCGISRNTLSAILFGVCLITPLMAQDGVPSPSFVGAERLKQGVPDYPTSQRRSNNSGIVEMVLMVGTDGLVFEPMVTHSTKPQFEKAALNTLGDYQFAPALLDGEPVESIYELRVMFMMEEGETAVSSKFARRYQAIRVELDKENPNQEKILKKLKEVENSNNLSPYAYAQLNQARFDYANLFGSIEDQISAIESMLLFEGRLGLHGQYLDRPVRKSMRQKLFTLNAQSQLYGDAFHAYNRLQEIDPDAEQQYSATLDEINIIRGNDQAVGVDLEIHTRGHTELYLFRRTFYLSEIQGELNSIKLRCRNKFMHLELPLDSEYEVPKDWGYCNLQVLGNAGTTFKILQR